MATFEMIQKWQEQLKEAIKNDNWSLAEALVEKITGAKNELPYTIKVVCSNCQHSDYLSIKKGVEANEAIKNLKCEKCECSTYRVAYLQNQ